ncbi:hypothetical protein K1W54_42515, partial [Micromonospora sp. CPCC 205371]|nr:hypothetical protein [Micromonospora sp. CPCC 205371]
TDARAQLAVAGTDRERLRAELRAAHETAAAAEGRLAELAVRLAAADADRDAAQARVAQLSTQVSDLAAALANLRPVPAQPAPQNGQEATNAAHGR